MKTLKAVLLLFVWGVYAFGYCCLAILGVLAGYILHPVITGFGYGQLSGSQHSDRLLTFLRSTLKDY